jgi:hypothetical protein
MRGASVLADRKETLVAIRWQRLLRERVRKLMGSLQEELIVVRTLILSLILILFASAASVYAGDASITAVHVPDGGIHPRVVSDTEGRIHLIYFKGEPQSGDVFYVASRDGGTTFSLPIRVNSQPGSVIITGTIRGPQIALGRGGRVHVAWMGSRTAEPKVGTDDVPILYTRLNDAGDAFEPQQNLIRTRSGLDGGGSIAADSEGNVYVGWHAPQTPKGDEGDRRVWLVRSKDDGKTFGDEIAADPSPNGACGCCGMRLFADSAGDVLILYRSAKEFVNRDIYLLSSRDKGDTFKSFLLGPWNIGQCVMSTAAITEGPGDGALLCAWEQQTQVYVVALDRKTLQPIGKPNPVPGQGENRKHPAVAVNADGQYIVAWTERTRWAKGGDVAWQVFERNGRPIAGSAGRASDLPVWGVPAAAVTPQGGFVIFY